MDRFLIACCIFSFITGMFVCVLIEQNRSHGCTIKVERDKQVRVFIGNRDD